MKTSYDIIFVGGGLANGLAAYYLLKNRKDREVLLIDQSSSLGGNHTWSFHTTDLTSDQFSWVSPFISKSWNDYDVSFPKYSRRINSGYHSIRSSQFHELLCQNKSLSYFLKQQVKTISKNEVTLASGESFQTACVIDGRGWDSTNPTPLGYQKFLGLDLTLESSHGLHSPLLMDATQPQIDGFRFFYLLPWSDRSILVEDTRYSNSPHINIESTKKEIFNYIEGKGWSLASVDREEVGVLPIPLDGGFSPGNFSFPTSGTKAGLFHATTGYSLPEAVRFSEALARLSPLTTESCLFFSMSHAKNHWRSQRFYRLLNRLLFRAADPRQRYKILEKFYRHSEGLLDRFYAGQSHALDKIRILSGKPPIPFQNVFRTFQKVKEAKWSVS